MSKVLLISTTTHKKGSTSKMILDEISEKLKEHELWFIDANELHIVPNLSCYSDGKENCAHKDSGEYRCWAHKLSHENPEEYGGEDEMSAIYESLLWCDSVIWGTSVRWGSHSALMQKIIERLNTFENRHVTHGMKNPLEGKRCGVVVTGQHYKSQEVAQHLVEQFSWFDFETGPGNVLTWQKTQDVYLEQTGNNNKALRKYLNTEEGKNSVKALLEAMKLD